MKKAHTRTKTNKNRGSGWIRTNDKKLQKYHWKLEVSYSILQSDNYFCLLAQGHLRDTCGEVDDESADLGGNFRKTLLQDYFLHLKIKASKLIDA